MRAIDGDALKRKAQKVATEAWKMKLTAKIETTLNQFIDWIDAQPTVHSEPHWIPVTERLPEADGYGHYFLVCLENGVVRIDGFSRTFTTRCPDGFYYETDHFTWRQNQNKVVAWMPLPEPMRLENK